MSSTSEVSAYDRLYEMLKFVLDRDKFYYYNLNRIRCPLVFVWKKAASDRYSMVHSVRSVRSRLVQGVRGGRRSVWTYWTNCL